MNSLSFALVLCVIGCCVAQRKDARAYIGQFSTLDACSRTCLGDRDQGCLGKTDTAGNILAYQCRCKSSYYLPVEEERCANECNNRDWSWFTYGTCVSAGEEAENDSVCTMTCGWRVRVWTTIFIIVLFLMALAVLLCILPIVICSCMSSSKMNKNKKNIKLQEAYRQGKLETIQKTKTPTVENSAIYATLPRSTSPANSGTPIVSHPYDNNTAYWAHYYNTNNTLRVANKEQDRKSIA